MQALTFIESSGSEVVKVARLTVPSQSPTRSTNWSSDPTTLNVTSSLQNSSIICRWRNFCTVGGDEGPGLVDDERASVVPCSGVMVKCGLGDVPQYSPSAGYVA
jgi:hypothetical protein